MRQRAERLSLIAAAVIQAGGSSAEEARLVADHLVEPTSPDTTVTASA